MQISVDTNEEGRERIRIDIPENETNGLVRLVDDLRQLCGMHVQKSTTDKSV